MTESNRSEVEVTFIDGEVKKYTISASTKIAQYLAREAANTGVLTLFNEEVATGIPLSQVRDYAIRPIVEPN